MSFRMLTSAVCFWFFFAACGDSTSDKPTDGAGAAASTTTSTTSVTGTDVEKPVVDFKGNVEADMTLSSTNHYLMKGQVVVQSGATLTIEAGTKIMGEKTSSATLIVSPGAKLIAEGTADSPIVFTSQAAPGERQAGDWGGVILLGNAPINAPNGQAQVEGLTSGGIYGGDSPTDNSGSLKYVRIEFSGIQLSADNEINGLTLGGVGSGTKLDYIMVNNTLDDCFEFFGGTVNGKHLVCANNGDDGFDWDFGYSGKLQFLALKQDPNVADDTNGFEGDNDADGSLNVPLSEPTIYNVTLCGKNKDVDKQQYGMLLRRSTKAHIFNAIVSGFEAGIDIRDEHSTIELKNSIFFGNVTQNVAYSETDTDEANKGTTTFDDDKGLDEVDWFTKAGNRVTDPELKDCFDDAPDFRPAADISENAKTPPSDGFFDAEATYVGAFTAADDWTAGNWVSYAAN